MCHTHEHTRSAQRMTRNQPLQVAERQDEHLKSELPAPCTLHKLKYEMKHTHTCVERHYQTQIWQIYPALYSQR